LQENAGNASITWPAKSTLLRVGASRAASVEKQVKHGRERLIGLELSCIARLTRRFNAKWVPGTFRKRDTPLSD
jgi:hypothetical protein